MKGLTVLVPAYNEAESVGDTVRSLLAQTRVPAAVIVIDDCSTDDTAAIARAAGARVICPPSNTGSKAGAQNFALPFVTTEFVMAIDADTTLALDAIEKLAPAFDDEKVAAACGFVLPRHVRTIWERGRYIEYLFAFTFYKQVQDFYGRPMISSGCFSMYRTAVLRQMGGWPTETLAEDMDLTWRLYQASHGVRFVPEAVSYPIEPADLHFLSKQLRRWSHGFVQNVRLHRRGLLDVPYLRSAVAVATWDAVIASVLFLFVLPLLALVLKQPWLLLGYIIDLPALLVPLMVGAVPRREVGRALASLPAFFLIRAVNGVFFVRAVWAEWVMRRPLLVYEKGH
jgi:poly-beta-1,6-N-acetyl-D-glucosamine synthase